MVKNILDTPEKHRRVTEMHPLKDIGRPEDVAGGMEELMLKA